VDAGFGYRASNGKGFVAEAKFGNSVGTSESAFARADAEINISR
jgi:hypothetical protein